MYAGTAIVGAVDLVECKGTWNCSLAEREGPSMVR